MAVLGVRFHSLVAVCGIALLFAGSAPGRGPEAGPTITIRRGSAVAIERTLSVIQFAGDPDMRSFDLNMDGLDDLVVRNSDGNVEVALASFQQQDATLFTLGTIPSPVALDAFFEGNFDRDGFKELLSKVTGGVAVINDAGGPAPSAPTTIINVNAIGDAFNMAAADLDGDGDDDVVVNRTPSGGDPGARAFIYRNDTPIGQNTAPGNWVQTDSVSLAPQTFAQEFSSVSVGRLNGDAHADLLFVSAQRAQCVVMGGNGDDTFEPINPATGALVPGGDPSANAVDMGSSPLRGLVKDLDNDTRNDLVVLNAGGVGVRFGNGDGTFGALVQAAAPASAYLLAGDIDGNGTGDIVSLVEVNGPVSQWDSLAVVKVNPDRSLQPTQLIPTIHQPRSAALFRVNSADLPGMLVAGNGQVALHRNIAGELGSFQRIGDTTGGGGVRELVVGDLTGDGYDDAWFSTFGFGNRVLVNPGDGTGIFGQTVIPGQGTSEAAPVAFVERPAIGRGALGFATNATDFFNLMAINDAGTQLEYINFISMPGDVRDVARLDYDGDGTVGFDDFAVLHTQGNPGISILSQHTDGSFADSFTPIDLSASSPAEGWWTKFFPFEDSFSKGLFVTGPGGAGMYVANGSGFDFFPAFGAAFAGGVSVAAGDLNGDGRSDVAVGRDLGSGAGAVTIAVQNGGGGPPTFAAAVTITVTGAVRSLDTGDLDNDDDVDVVVVSDNGAGLSAMQRTTILRNDGTGQFLPQDVTTHPAGSSPQRVVLADLHNASGTRGASATAGPEIVQGGRGPNGFSGVLIYENVMNFAPPPCAGDADGNGIVSFADVTSVLQFFGSDYTPGTGPGDANHNGPVNFADVTSVLQFFNLPCP